MVPHSYWQKIDEEGLYAAARIGLVELLLSGTTTAADHHYMFADTYRFDPSDVIFGSGAGAGLAPRVPAAAAPPIGRTFDTPEIIPMPIEPLGCHDQIG